MMNLIRLSGREKILAVLSVGCIGAVLIVQCLGDRMRHSLGDISRQTAALEESLRQSRVLLGRHRRLQSDYRQALLILGDSKNDQDLMAQLLSDINAVAKNRKVQLQELNSLPVETNDGVRTVKIRIVMTGSWHAMLDFFNDLQRSPHRFDVDEAVLEKAAAADGLISCQLTVSRWSMQDGPP